MNKKKDTINSKHYRDNILPLVNKIYNYALELVSDKEEASKVVIDSLNYLWQYRKNIEKSNSEIILVKKVRELSFFKVKNSKFKSRPFNNLEWEEGRWESVNLPQGDNLDQLMGFLPQLHAEMINLRVLVGLDDDCIAMVTGMGINNIQSILADARKSLRKALSILPCEEVMELQESLSKFYSGQTCLAEERELEIYFSGKIEKSRSDADSSLLTYFNDKRKCSMAEDIYNSILGEVDSNIQNKLVRVFFSRKSK